MKVPQPGVSTQVSDIAREVIDFLETGSIVEPANCRARLWTGVQGRRGRGGVALWAGAFLSTQVRFDSSPIES